ncbi:hypothetical protein LZ31DRAFT_553527, partial [Colletotrichum somersetense]
MLFSSSLHSHASHRVSAWEQLASNFSSAASVALLSLILVSPRPPPTSPLGPLSALSRPNPGIGPRLCTNPAKTLIQIETRMQNRTAPLRQKKKKKGRKKGLPLPAL